MKFLFTLFLSLVSSSLFAKGGKVTLSPEKTIVLGGVISDSIYAPFSEALDKLAPEKKVDMIISSPGGSVIVGSLIIDRMEQLKLEGVNFRCVVRDLAASMAFQILLHCNERYATPHSFLLWHPVRIFMQAVITADLSQSLMIQLKQADDVALHDLKASLPMPEEQIEWHFKNETLHQAYNLLNTAPSFFKGVTNNVENLRPAKPLLDTSALGNLFGLRQIVYIHERFIKKDTTK